MALPAHAIVMFLLHACPDGWVAPHHMDAVSGQGVELAIQAYEANGIWCEKEPTGRCAEIVPCENADTDLCVQKLECGQ